MGTDGGYRYSNYYPGLCSCMAAAKGFCAGNDNGSGKRLRTGRLQPGKEERNCIKQVI